METFKSPPRVGMLPDKEYGIEYALRASDEAIALAEAKDWKTTFQIIFHGIEITYAGVTVFRDDPAQIVFEIAFAAPNASPQSPIYFDVAGRQFVDYATMVLGTGNLESQEAAWIAARIGEPGEVSTFYYKGYSGERVGEDGTGFGEHLADTLGGIGAGIERFGKYALIGIGGIVLIKVLDVMRD